MEEEMVLVCTNVLPPPSVKTGGKGEASGPGLDGGDGTKGYGEELEPQAEK